MKRIILFLFMSVCVSCNDVRLPDPSVRLVVEAWAEDNGRPVVIVTTVVPVSSEYQELSGLQDHIARWAKVTISDGTEKTVLSGRVNRNHFPPYIYTKDTYRILPDKEYSISVEYGGEKATSSVRVPHCKPLDFIRVEAVPGKADAYRLVAGISDYSEEVDRYKFFVRREKKDSSYMSSFLGYVSDESFASSQAEVAIYNGMNLMSEELEQYFTGSDHVHVKFCVLDDVTWQYWSDYEDLTSLSRNPFFPVTSAIRSNISGGLGYFSGYGASYYEVSIPDSIAVSAVRVP